MDNQQRKRKNPSSQPLGINYGKIPPQAVDFEMAILGVLMTSDDSYSVVSGIVKEESFYKEEHRIIFRAISELNSKGKPTEPSYVTHYLKSKDELDQVGGAYGLTNIVSMSPMGVNIVHYAKVVQQKYIQREIIRESYSILSRAFDESEDVDDLLSYSQVAFEQLDSFSINEGRTSFEVAQEAIQEISDDCAVILSGKQSGIPTGLSALDRAVGGWKSPYFVVLGARPAEGKTTLALHFAISAAKRGIWVNFYSYEMTSAALFKIAIAGESGANRSHIRDGRITAEEWNAINSSLDRLANLPILWYQDPDIKASQIKSNIRKNKKKGKCGLVIIDYVQLMPPEDPKQNREGQISGISRTLKRATVSEKTPIIALSQLNRDVDKRVDRKPTLSDLRESGSLEQDPDIVLMPFSSRDENDNVIDRFINVAKNRHGMVGVIDYAANSQMTKLFDKESEINQNKEPIQPLNYYEPNKGLNPSDSPF